MNISKVTAGFLFAMSTNVDAATSTLDDPKRSKQFGTASQLSWETAVGLPNKHAESQYYAAVLLRRRNQFFGLSSYRVYELGSITRTTCYRCASDSEERGSEIETLMLGVSEQFDVVSTRYLTLEAGLGGYVKKPTDSVGSVFTFGERIGVRSNVKRFEVEVFYRHFSNGSFTSDNSGYDFVGLSFQSRF